MRKFTKRSAVIAGVAAVAIGGGAAAWAVNGWSINGIGKADAKAAQIKDLSATSTFGGNLYPGVKTTLATKMKNPNEFPVALTGTASVENATVTPAGDDATDCANKVKIPGMFITSFPGTPSIPANTPEFAIDSDVTIGDLPKTCAGKTIKIEYRFEGVSQANAA